jgi:hypothetical protein
MSLMQNFSICIALMGEEIASAVKSLKVIVCLLSFLIVSCLELSLMSMPNGLCSFYLITPQNDVMTSKLQKLERVTKCFILDAIRCYCDSNTWFQLPTSYYPYRLGTCCCNATICFTCKCIIHECDSTTIVHKSKPSIASNRNDEVEGSYRTGPSR